MKYFGLSRRAGVALAALGAASCFAQKPELIDIGDHKLAMARSGEGSPTVVLESGAGSAGIPGWATVLARVGKFTSVVSYSRAGRGASEPATTPRTLSAVEGDLHELLARAGYHPPYILVGSSLGGIYVRAFAILYPEETAGLVTVDGSNERQQIEFDRVAGISPALRALMDAKAPFGTENDPASTQEFSGLQKAFATGDLGLPGKLPNVPMVVIFSTRPDNGLEVSRVWRALQTGVFQSTTHGMLVATDQSGHGITGNEPDLVVNAIRWVYDAVKVQTASSQRAVVIPPETLRSHAGVYRCSPTLKIEFVVERGQLVFYRTATESILLQALSANEFLAPGFQVHFVFAPIPADGKAQVSFRATNGNKFEGIRVTEALTDPPKPSVLLAPEVLDKYVGAYALAADLIVTVDRRGDSLTAQITGEAVTDLVAQSSTRFNAKSGTPAYEFKVAPDGHLSGLVLSQSGVEFPAKKIR